MPGRILGLHVLGDDLEPQVAGQTDHGRGERRAVGVGRDVPDEGPIYLEQVDREGLQAMERGVAGPRYSPSPLRLAPHSPCTGERTRKDKGSDASYLALT